ncbi:hypothetical protein BUALT_Bualt17G0107400 [Buddleja alternifolia]|uniref:Uncharacterized protein n=1 Tax=Buddleja alternifolia TaxID=168488 RepID=A0AAV6WGV9_9LAMI|nr:hypothetical protein BUALT_Bualt17G0107400 [Buddleja alternifolia]
MVSASPLAMKRDANHDHKLVDENMVVLKMRIQEMKMKEEAVRAPAPSDHWMNWEKEWYKNYDSDVYEAVGLLQSLMMNSRPSLVIGIVALLMLSSSLSLVEVLRGLLNIVINQNMASISSLSSQSLSFIPLSKVRTIKPNSNRRTLTKTFAARREAHNDNFSGRLVDESLIVLRKRIHEMKMIERNYEPPKEWMDWEKRFYATYDSMICDAMGHLQSYLMETRPSLVLGMIALITLSVPISSVVVIFNLLELTKGVISGIHLIS